MCTHGSHTGTSHAPHKLHTQLPHEHLFKCSPQRCQSYVRCQSATIHRFYYALDCNTQANHMFHSAPTTASNSRQAKYSSWSSTHSRSHSTTKWSTGITSRGVAALLHLNDFSSRLPTSAPRSC